MSTTRPEAKSAAKSTAKPAEEHSSALKATLTGILDQLRARRDIEPLDASIDLEGETVLVTGANSGLGRGIARDLARRRASKLILACRSGIPETGEALRRETGNQNIEMRRVDLADFESIEAMVQELKRDGIVLDRVIFNAGVVSSGGAKTREGFEQMFGVNFIANALLTLRLLEEGIIPSARASRTKEGEEGAPPRIVYIASDAHRSGSPIVLSSFGDYRDFGLKESMKEYGHSKLALMLFAHELAARFKGELEIFTLCPGAVNSNISREAPRLIQPVLRVVMRLLFASPDEAAEPAVFLAKSDTLRGRTGVYFHMRAERDPAEAVSDLALRREVFARTLELLKERGAAIDPRAIEALGSR